MRGPLGSTDGTAPNSIEGSSGGGGETTAQIVASQQHQQQQQQSAAESLQVMGPPSSADSSLNGHLQVFRLIGCSVLPFADLLR